MPNDQHLRTDLQLTLKHSELRPVYVVGSNVTTRATPAGPRRMLDVPTVTGGPNLGQAIVLRLLTPRGELDALAHPDYGSRLHELIGQPNTDTTRNLVRLYILEALRAESRIEKILDITVDRAPDARMRDVVLVTLRVKPTGGAAPVSIGPLGVELGS
jgi:phage baseplate assembly protein W